MLDWPAKMKICNFFPADTEVDRERIAADTERMRMRELSVAGMKVLLKCVGLDLTPDLRLLQVNVVNVRGPKEVDRVMVDWSREAIRLGRG